MEESITVGGMRTLIDHPHCFKFVLLRFIWFTVGATLGAFWNTFGTGFTFVRCSFRCLLSLFVILVIFHILDFFLIALPRLLIGFAVFGFGAALFASFSFTRALLLIVLIVLIFGLIRLIFLRGLTRLVFYFSMYLLILLQILFILVYILIVGMLVLFPDGFI